MEVALGILLLGALVGVSLLASHLRKKATRALNRNLFERDKHHRGQATTHEVIEFAAPMPARAVLDTVRDRLALPVTMPAAFVAALYLADDQPGALVFGFGNKLAQTFSSALLAEDLPGGGSRATYRVLTWVEGDGIVRGIPEMELLANTIRAVAAELGSSYGASAPAVVATRACSSCGSTELGERFCTDCGAAVA